MKNITMFFALLILTGTGYLFAQGSGFDDRAWSRISTDSERPVKVEVPIWTPAPQVPRYYNLGDGITVYPNFRPHPTTNTTQSEMSVDIHPFNNNIVFGSANATPWPVTSIWGTGVYWSLDGSASWTGFDNPPFGTNGGDPASIIGPDGVFYEAYLVGGSYTLGVAVSTNNGTNWTTHIAYGVSNQDKEHIMVDKTISSPYSNRLYYTWSDLNGGEAALVYSTNFGSTWSAYKNLSGTITPMGSAFAQGPNVQTATNGDVYVAYAIYDANWQDGEDAIGFSKSTDGGNNWTALRVYDHVNFGVRSGGLPPKNLRTNSFPAMAVDRSGGPNDGNIYICWSQRAGVPPAGSDPDVVLITSTDGGATWTTPMRVNDDPINNGKDQLMPWCTVDQSTGQLILVFYDSRNVVNTKAEVYMARSFDGGNSFENFLVSDHSFNLGPISGFSGNYAGDYIGVAAVDDIAYPFWMDISTNVPQGWMAKVEFGPPCPIDPPSNPNPANGATGLPLTGNSLSWTNGAGATQIEVWFGQGSTLNMVYSGAPITSLSLASFEPLTFNTSYGWQVKGKNDTCTVSGPSWAFTTMQDPNLSEWCDEFTNLNNWTIVGPLGMTNWSAAGGSNAGGTPPELQMSWSPSFNGISKIRSTAINLPNNKQVNYSFNYFFDWYANPSGTITVAVTYDGGATSSAFYTQVDATENVGPLVVTGSFTTPTSGSQNAQLEVTFNGNSFNNDNIYWDNMCLSWVVPVELTSFTAVAANDEVELNWRTATETNNQGFQIERMNAGGTFEQIGYVAGFGTTTEPKAYSFVDSKLEAGSYTYRLKQIDFDGTFTYSEQVNVDVDIPLVFALEQNYPNPFNPSTTIKYSIAEDGLVKLAIYNMLGEEVTTLVNTQQKAGRYEVSFNAGGLSSGVYVYRIESANFTASKKLMLMK
jgi:hypothetical protein